MSVFTFQPKPYSFTYGVKDFNSGTDFSRAEERSGAVTKGEYRTALPDGRIQIVSYVADHNGYKASVTYEGEPNYPEPIEPYKPSGDVFTVFPDFYDKNKPLPLVTKPPLPPPPPPKLSYDKFRHSNKVKDPFKVIDPYTKDGKVVGLDYDYYDYNDIYSSSKPTPKPTYETYRAPSPTPKPTYAPYRPPPPTLNPSHLPIVN